MSSSESSKIIPLEDHLTITANTIHDDNQSNLVLEHSSQTSNHDIISGNNNDGGNGMKNDYVTHKELDYAIDKISSKIDLMEAHIDTKFESINTKFAIQKVWYIFTAITIISATVGLITFFK
ncbi:hypothetical protein [Paucilactobacillus kaifaensis]|uniref:hypothetical protein n=1 Tax=Paucilactobacillus kaifaensis TaxID=2559921 RepID=UPI0010F8EF96|nr:hypothetical protein [Paucilactobacillus kaifaensis]